MSQQEAHFKKAIARAFDLDSETLKTTITNAEIDINVSAFTDSIKIGDASGKLATITEIGGKKAVDVNVVDLTIDAANDSIKIKNGNNELAVNADGSINVNAGTGSGFQDINVSTEVTVGTTSTTLLSQNLNRKYIHLINNGTSVVFIKYGSAAQVNKGIRLGAGAMLVVTGQELFLGQINAISNQTTNIEILEGI